MNQEQTKEECPNCGRLLEDCNGNCIFGPDSWKELQKPTRSPKFSLWMESLNDRKVKRAGGNYSEQKFQKNWSTSRR